MTEPDSAVQDSPAAPYPAHRAADVVLADGSPVHIRPIRPSDADAIVALHSRFSERTRYLRYFSPYPRIPDRDLRRFVNVDHRDREAFVAALGGDLIAVGRYERLDPDSAEVAFVVEDAHQGRGLGSVLLEHLAAAAREAGIRRFVAEVLPENGQMMRIFTDAGYVVDRHYDDGVVDLRFDTAETARSLEVARAREQRTEARSIARLLAPGSVAVVGVGRREQSLGRAVFTNLRTGGYTGDLYPVNPSLAEVDGVRCYPSLRAVPDTVDLAVIAVPAAAVPAVLADCAEKGVRGVVVISSGFAETGPDGARAERELVELARANGARVIGPNCLGVLNTAPEVRLNATLAPRLPGRGRVGFFSQSGALGIALLDQVDQRGIGLSTFISAGNRADVSGNDLLQYWQDDPATDVVLLYLETFGNPRKFARVARRLARRKPVVVLKSRARALGLSGAGAGPTDPGLEALFESSGVIRVDNLDQMFGIAQPLAYQPLPAGRRVAIVGNSSALGVLAADACGAAGLEVVDGWPVDLGPETSPAALAGALREAAADPRVDAVLVVFIPVLSTPGTAYADALVEAAASTEVPVVSTFLAATGVPERLRRAGPGGAAGPGSVPSYSSPEEAAYALGRVAAYAQWRRTPGGALPTLPGVDEKAARAVLDRTLAAEMAFAASGVSDIEPVTLADEDAAALLSAYCIEVWPVRRCADADEAVAAAEEFGYPVAVKAADEVLRHRVDLGGVRLDVSDADEVRAAIETIASRPGFAGAGVIVQPMAPPGVATVVEVAQDSAFGPVVGFGLGGVATDLLGDRAWRAVPLTDADAHALLRAPLAAPMLFGHRGATPVDARALEDLLLRVGLLADELPELRELELNPVIASESGLTVLHATVQVAPPTPRPDVGPRRLR